MKSILHFVVAVFALSIFASPVFAANSEWSSAYNACAKEAEKNEVEVSDLRTFIKGCMVESGISSADADSTIDELTGPQANKTEKDES